MLNLSVLMKFDSILKAEKLLGNNNYRLLKKLNEKQFKAFFTWYLEHEYNITTKFPMFSFSLINTAEEKMEIDEIEELVMNSKYFETIPLDRIIYFLRCGSFLKIVDLDHFTFLKTFFTSKIKDYDILIELINGKRNIDYDYVFRSLVEIKDIEKLIEYNNILFNLEDRRKLIKVMIDSCYYTLEDFQNFIFNTILYIKDIVNILVELYNKENVYDKNEILDMFIFETDIISPGYQESKYSLRDIRYSYAYEITRNGNISLEMKNDIAKRLLEEKNYDFIYEWFLNNIDCDYNYKIIDTMMLEDEGMVKKVLASVSNKYIEYALTKLLDRDRSFIRYVIEYICRDYDIIGQFEVERIDKILEFIYYRYYDFKISKISAINLIKLGSKYISKFMSEYEFSEEERKDISDFYSWTGGDLDFQIVYGKYLRSGDKKYLLRETDAKSMFLELENKRK